MESNYKKIKIKQILPSNLIIKSAGSDFYRIGLSLFPFGSEKRKNIYNPYRIILINVIFIIRAIISSFISDDNKDIFFYIGDFAYFLDVNSRYHLNSCLIFALLITIVSHLIHIWYYKKGVKPSYLKPFEMMSGLFSPQSIGLTDCEDVYKLVTKSKLLLHFSKTLSKCFGFLGYY